MASLYLAKWQQLSTDAGAPLNGGKLLFSITTTTTLKNTYPTEANAIAGTSPNVNPIILDTDGRSPVEVWISGRYRLRTYTSADVLIADDDPIEDTASGSSAQAQAGSYGGNNSGSANAMVFAYSPALTAYTAGQILYGRILADNSAAVTINAGGGVKSLVKRDGAALVSGDLQGPEIIQFAYDSTTDVFRLLSAAADAGAQDANGNAPMRVGLHTVPVLAASMISASTNGAGTSITESTTNKVMLNTKDFDKTTSEFAQFSIPMPKSWNLGTFTADFQWTADAGTPAETMIFGIQAVAVSNDDAIDAAWGTGVTASDVLLATGDLHVSPTTAACTIAGTPAAYDQVFFRVYRDISDTLNADARLISLRLYITYSAPNDV